MAKSHQQQSELQEGSSSPAPPAHDPSIVSGALSNYDKSVVTNKMPANDGEQVQVCVCSLESQAWPLATHNATSIKYGRIDFLP